jgi:hypothetical protein
VTDAGYVIAGWSVSGAALLGYAVWLARRTRRALDRLPPDERERLR